MAANTEDLLAEIERMRAVMRKAMPDTDIGTLVSTDQWCQMLSWALNQLEARVITLDHMLSKVKAPFDDPTFIEEG